MAAIKLQNVTKEFGRKVIIEDLSLSINNGEFLVIVGPSGSGKSTLLRLIAGLEEVSSGQLFLDNDDITERPPEMRHCSMVFQSYALYPHMTVARNISFALSGQSMSAANCDHVVQKVAESLQIENLLHRLPKDLSGGQRQRVAIARAIVKEPKVFLFDEPLSNLDAKLRVQTRFELMRLHHNLETTMIHVTHDQVEAMTLADRIVILNQGRIEQCDSPQLIYYHPKNQFVAGFIGSPEMNFISAKLESMTDTHLKIATDHESYHIPHHLLTSELTAPMAITLGFRPEHVLLEKDPHALKLQAHVIRQEFIGRESNLLLDYHGQNLIVGITAQQSFESNRMIDLYIPYNRLYVFSAKGHCLNDYENFPLYPSASTN